MLIASTLCALAASAAPAGPGVDWKLTTEQLASLCRAELSLARSRVRTALGSGGPAAPLDRLLAVESASTSLDEALAAPSALSSAAEDAQVRVAASECMESRAAFNVELLADPALYAAAIAAQVSARGAVDRMLAQRYAESGRHGGAALDAKARAELTALLDQLHGLESAFIRALDEDQSKAAIEISAEEAASLPASFVKPLKPSPSGKGLMLPVGLNTSELAMKNLRPQAARERYQRAFNMIGGAANIDRLKKALALRRQAAQKLGYRSWAEYRLDVTSARTPERAAGLARQLDAALLPRAWGEVGALAALKEKAGEPGQFSHWDLQYYAAQYEQASFAVDPEVVRQYFPADVVIPGALDVFGQLLGLKFEPAPQAPVWASGVSAYAVKDAASGALLGWFYVDIVPRDGKLTRPAFGLMRLGRALPGGGRVLPIAAVLGNGPPAAPGERALFTHQGVVEIFHELGHMAHAVLSVAPYATLSGGNGRTDFIEAPSQLFETWAWDPAVLRRVSRHVRTGQPLPEELATKLTGLRFLNAGTFWTRQAFIATYDLELNGPAEVKDPTALWFELWGKMTALSPTLGTIPPASLLPEMGGYDANYYGYLWSRVWAVDMASVFRRNGLTDPATGMRYRRVVLEPGATVEPEAVLQAFLGRPPRADALYDELGIAPPGKPGVDNGGK